MIKNRKKPLPEQNSTRNTKKNWDKFSKLYVKNIEHRCHDDNMFVKGDREPSVNCITFFI